MAKKVQRGKTATHSHTHTSPRPALLHDITLSGDRCGYIGQFYEDVYKDATCTQLQGNIEAVAGPALTVAILMFISFCIQVCVCAGLGARVGGCTCNCCAWWNMTMRCKLFWLVVHESMFLLSYH